MNGKGDTMLDYHAALYREVDELEALMLTAPDDGRGWTSPEGEALLRVEAAHQATVAAYDTFRKAEGL